MYIIPLIRTLSKSFYSFSQSWIFLNCKKFYNYLGGGTESELYLLNLIHLDLFVDFVSWIQTGVWDLLETLQEIPRFPESCRNQAATWRTGEDNGCDQHSEGQSTGQGQGNMRSRSGSGWQL